MTSKELGPEPEGGSQLWSSHIRKEQAGLGPGVGDEPVDSPSEAGALQWDPGPCCMEGGTCEYKQ